MRILASTLVALALLGACSNASTKGDAADAPAERTYEVIGKVANDSYELYGHLPEGAICQGAGGLDVGTQLTISDTSGRVLDRTSIDSVGRTDEDKWCTFDFVFESVPEVADGYRILPVGFPESTAYFISLEDMKTYGWNAGTIGWEWIPDA